jgi:CheY-like chemotaxis protein
VCTENAGEPILRGLEVVLASWGYAVVVASSEAEAMDRLMQQDRPPDIIIADYRLRAGRTGLQAIRHIRAHYGNRPIPSIVITGDTAPERLREAEASGYRLLHKPVSANQLQAVIETYRPSAGPV